MNILILPGYSLKNKIWAENLKKELNSGDEIQIINWEHWETGSSTDDWLDIEAQKIVKDLTSQVNIIAHSAGTFVAMKILKLKPDLIHKIILCGIPVNDFHTGDQKLYETLNLLKPENILCVQNENDNHGSFSQAEKIIHALNSNIKIISQPRSDHLYSYPEEFQEFLNKVE